MSRFNADSRPGCPKSRRVHQYVMVDRPAAAARRQSDAGAAGQRGKLAAGDGLPHSGFLPMEAGWTAKDEAGSFSLSPRAGRTHMASQVGYPAPFGAADRHATATNRPGEARLRVLASGTRAWISTLDVICVRPALRERARVREATSTGRCPFECRPHLRPGEVGPCGFPHPGPLPEKEGEGNFCPPHPLAPDPCPRGSRRCSPIPPRP